MRRDLTDLLLDLAYQIYNAGNGGMKLTPQEEIIYNIMKLECRKNDLRKYLAAEHENNKSGVGSRAEQEEFYYGNCFAFTELNYNQIMEAVIKGDFYDTQAKIDFIYGRLPENLNICQSFTSYIYSQYSDIVLAENEPDPTEIELMHYLQIAIGKMYIFSIAMYIFPVSKPARNHSCEIEEITSIDIYFEEHYKEGKKYHDYTYKEESQKSYKGWELDDITTCGGDLKAWYQKYCKSAGKKCLTKGHYMLDSSLHEKYMYVSLSPANKDYSQNIEIDITDGHGNTISSESITYYENFTVRDTIIDIVNILRQKDIKCDYTMWE